VDLVLSSSILPKLQISRVSLWFNLASALYPPHYVGPSSFQSFVVVVLEGSHVIIEVLFAFLPVKGRYA
jgi:hypothetical protein